MSNNDQITSLLQQLHADQQDTLKQLRDEQGKLFTIIGEVKVDVNKIAARCGLRGSMCHQEKEALKERVVTLEKEKIEARRSRSQFTKWVVGVIIAFVSTVTGVVALFISRKG